MKLFCQKPLIPPSTPFIEPLTRRAFAVEELRKTDGKGG